MHFVAKYYKEVKKMTPQEILNIIEAFFEAILRVLKSLGLVKEEEATEEETTEA